MDSWKVDMIKFDSEYNGSDFIKGVFWYATLNYEDGMILVCGRSTDAPGFDYDETGTAVGAIIDGMKKLSTKAQVSFARWAYETKQLPAFYWLYKDTFVAKGKIYEIDIKTIIDVENYERIPLENIPFDPVKQGRTHPIVLVTRRIEKIKKEYQIFDDAEETWEKSWIDGIQG